MKNIDQLFNQFNKSTPGCAIAVVKNDTILLQKNFGLADVPNNIPITKDTAFRLASLTKPFTTMAIMIIKERALVSYDDSIRKYLPKLPLFWKNVTIRTLLTHTSGSPDHEKPLYKMVKFEEEPTISDAFKILQTEKQLVFQPGTRFAYSDAGYVLLALVIEKITQQKYADFLDKNVFQKLNLRNTFVMDETKPNKKTRAYGYRKIKNAWELYDYDPLNYIVGDEGIYSSISDLTIWQKAWMKDLLVSQKTLDEALSLQILSDGQKGRCGFSWFIEKRNGRKIIFQDGFWVGFNNIMLTDVTSNTTVIMLSNTTMFPGEKKKVNLARAILDIVTKENML